MKLVTVATHSERYYPYLKLSAERNGHELVVLGWGETWKGFVWRFQLIKDYLQTVPKNEIICFVDAYDVLILRGPDEMERDFKRIIGDDREKILISEDRSSKKGILYDLTNRTFFHKCGDRYINAGTYMGYSSSIIDIMNSLCQEFNCAPNENDQILLQRFCVNHQNLFKVDTSSEIFLVICNFISKINPSAENFTIRENSLVYNNSRPAILHGTANADMDDIIRDLGYDTTLYSANNDDKLNYFIKNFTHFLKELIKKFWYIIIVFIAALFLYVRTPRTMRTFVRKLRLG